MAKLLVISNGHGEDVSGSLLGIELKKFGHKVHAFPLVGRGNAYRKAGITALGLKKEFSTGGLGYTSFLGRVRELVEGQLFYLIWSLIRVLILSRRYDLLIVVGDVVPVLAAWLTTKQSVVYLVAYSSHYEGKLKLPWPTKYFLQSNRFLEIYCRDQLTADDLQIQLNRSVVFFGNPFMDPVFTLKPQLPKKVFRLGIFPGSRRPELDNNFLLILNVLETLPQKILENTEISFDMALVDALKDEDLITLTFKHHWEVIQDSSSIQSLVLKSGSGPCRLQIHRDSFPKVLQSSDACLCMAGTAAEQAIGLAKPVIQLPGKGPQFTPLFAEAQRRLLGPTVFCALNNLNNPQSIFCDTANLILEIFKRINKDDDLKKICDQQATLRLGKQGGTQRMAKSIHNFTLSKRKI